MTHLRENDIVVGVSRCFFPRVRVYILREAEVAIDSVCKLRPLLDTTGLATSPVITAGGTYLSDMTTTTLRQPEDLVCCTSTSWFPELHSAS